MWKKVKGCEYFLKVCVTQGFACPTRLYVFYLYGLSPALFSAFIVFLPSLQIRQSAAVMLRMRVKNDVFVVHEQREVLQYVALISALDGCLLIGQNMHRSKYFEYILCILGTLSQSLKYPCLSQVGLLLLSKVVESNPEPFKPHYRQLLQLFGTVLQDLDNPTAMYYCILTLTAMTAYTGTEEMNLMRALIPRLIIALKHLIKADQGQASDAMEVFDELMESEVSIIVPHIAEIVHFCLEVSADTTLTDSLRVKALSCIAFLIRLKSKTVLKQKLLNPILQTVFPVLSAAPPPGEEDPEDEENGDEGDTDNESPKHFAAQVIDTMALHMPPEKLFQQLMPLTQVCLASENPYERKAGLMCMAVLAEGCADHIRTNPLVCFGSEIIQSKVFLSYFLLLSSMLQTVCQSLSDNNQVVRSAGLFALGQFSEHLQPEIEPYLPTLMETMLSALSNAENLKLKELAVSAIGAIANAAKDKLVPYFPPVIESLKGFLTDTRDEMRALQTQALDTLSVLARTIGKDVFSPLAAECVQLGLNLTNAIDDPDLRRCTYSLFSAVSTVSPDCLSPHLTAITTIMLLSLKSTEGVTVSLTDTVGFPLSFSILISVLSPFPRFSVENAYIDEKEDACDALGEIAFNTGAAFQPFLESSFQQVYELRDFPHEDVRRAAFGAMGQFCRAQHKVCFLPSVRPSAMQKLLGVVLPSFLEAVRGERERQVVMGVLEAMNAVLKACQGEALQSPGRLQEISQAIRDVLKKRTVCQDGGGDEADDDEQQAEYDAMLQEFAGEGIPLLASAVPADTFQPHLNELLPLIMNKAKSSCTVADRSFSVGTLGEILQSLVSVSGGRACAGKLSNRLLPVLVAGVRDSDSEVRNNSVFGLGALAQAAGPLVAQDYPMMLSLFSNLLSKEQDRRVIDNLCAALCRMIMSHMEGVPLEQVLSAFSCMGFYAGPMPNSRCL
uniref:Importin 4 n=1 Tax=Oncorhynchus mykiss TaxID=8022 RepID=A0A8C7NWN4_ONCMY